LAQSTANSTLATPAAANSSGLANGHLLAARVGRRSPDADSFAMTAKPLWSAASRARSLADHAADRTNGYGAPLA
jgi:hypothetical protein